MAVRLPKQRLHLFAKTIRIAAFLTITAGTFSCTGGDSPSPATQTTKNSGRTIEYVKDIRFLDEAGSIISEIKAAVVDNDEDRNMGLMDVRSMPENRGMLFIFDRDAQLSFWMANTPLSLDIIFVNKAKEIVRIHANTPPLSERSFESGEDAMYAIEVNAGYCLRHDIREGLKVDF